MRLRPLRNDLGEDVRVGEVSGSRLLIAPRPGFVRSSAVLGVDLGGTTRRGVDPATGEAFALPAGVAHFLEHAVFEDGAGDVTDRFADLGASVNAATGHVATWYQTSTDRDATPCVDLLLDFVLRPRLDAERVAREREVIRQEILMYEDDPGWRSFSTLLRALFPTHPVRDDIAGTPASLAAIDVALLERCHRAFYAPGRLVLAVAGPVDPERVAAVFERHLEGRQGAAKAPPGAPSEEPPPAPGGGEDRLEVSRPRLLLGFRDPERGGGGGATERRELLSAIALELLCGRASRTHERLYGEGVIDESFSAHYSGEADFGFAVLGGECDDPIALEARLREEIDAFLRRPLDVEAFERIRARILGMSVRLFDSQEATVSALAAGALRDTTPFEALAILRDLRRDEVLERARSLLDSGLSTRAILRPAGGAPGR